MITEVYLPNNIDGNLNKIRSLVKRKILNTFDRFKERIRMIKVTFSDENGPKGGQDTRCSIHILSDSGDLLTSHKDSNPGKAVSLTIKKARQSLIESIRRKRGR